MTLLELRRFYGILTSFSLTDTNTMKALIQTAILLIATLASHSQALSPQQMAPDFTLPNLETTSQNISLSDYRGQIVLVDFWAAWCGPCRKSMPMLEGLYHSQKDKGFTILAISLDDSASTARQFASQFQISYPLLLDAEAAVSDTYGVIGMPTSYLIGRNGELLWKHQGFQPKDMATITEKVETALAQ